MKKTEKYLQSLQEAEKYLQSLRSMKFKIDKYEKIRKSIHIDTAYINGTTIGDRVQSSPKADKLETAAIKCLERIRVIDLKLAKLKTEYLNARIEACSHIEELPEGQCKRFLIDYYIDCMNMKQLDKMYGYTDESSIYQLKRRAIRKFEKKYKKQKHEKGES